MEAEQKIEQFEMALEIQIDDGEGIAFWNDEINEKPEGVRSCPDR